MNFQKMAFVGWQYYLLQPESNTRKKKMDYKKWITNFGLVKQSERMTPEKTKEEQSNALSKAQKIVLLDQQRHQRRTRN